MQHRSASQAGDGWGGGLMKMEISTEHLKQLNGMTHHGMRRKNEYATLSKESAMSAVLAHFAIHWTSYAVRDRNGLPAAISSLSPPARRWRTQQRYKSPPVRLGSTHKSRGSTGIDTQIRRSELAPHTNLGTLLSAGGT